jgi:hypothetical protein
VDKMQSIDKGDYRDPPAWNRCILVNPPGRYFLQFNYLPGH